MLATSIRPQGKRGADSAAIDQLYVTHCLYGEGVSREAGFGVRASSTLDPLLLRFAVEYPPHEWPPGLDGGETAGPRRLALVRVPGGRTALIHSVARQRDDGGRANDFLSHMLFAGEFDVRGALASWGSPEWAADCAGDLDKEMPARDDLPLGDPVADRALTAFLQAPSLATDPALATLTCPGRLAEDRERRRQLLTVVLRGSLQVVEAGPAAARGRLYLLAEPGLVALLLYGAARLLPRGVAASLTFSTYENALTALRSYRHAQIVGTWMADPARGLDPEFFSTRGYALDTFNHRFSDELAADPDAALDQWVELAARGEWATIDRLHALLGETTTSVVSYKEGVKAARLARRLSSGRASDEDLLTLRQYTWGPALLEEHEAEVWPIVRDGSLSNPRLRKEYADLLRAHLPELEAQVALALRKDPPGEWQSYWRLVWSLLEATPALLRDAFERVLPEPPNPPALCFAILAEMQALQVSAADPRVSLHPLLKQLGGDALDDFARSTLPREWFVWVVCYALLRPETRQDAARNVHDGDDDLVRVFWQQFKLLKDEGQRRAILSALVATVGDRGPAFLGRLLASGCGLRPETLSWLLEALGAWQRNWAEFWSCDDHLGLLLERVREFGAAGAPVWDRFCDALDHGVLPPGDPYQQTLLLNLGAVQGRPGSPLPDKAAETIADWALLRDHFEKAAAVAPEARTAVIAACNRRRLDPIDELSRYFARFVEPQVVHDELLADFVGFVHSFYPEPAEYPDHQTRLVGWLQIVGVSQDPVKRAACQDYYLDQLVPREFRRRLAEETHRAGKLLPAVYEKVAAQDSDHAGNDPHHRVGDRSGSGVLRSIGRRLPWLLTGFAGGVLAAGLLYFFLKR